MNCPSHALEMVEVSSVLKPLQNLKVWAHPQSHYGGSYTFPSHSAVWFGRQLPAGGILNAFADIVILYFSKSI